MRTFSITLVIHTLLFISIASGRHLQGGEFYYSCLGANAAQDSFQVSLEFKILRDCDSGGAPFDPFISLGVFYEMNGQFQFQEPERPNDYESRSLFTKHIDLPDLGCPLTVDHLCFEEGLYRFVFWLPIRSTPYHFVYQRCCLYDIRNIEDSDEIGLSYTMSVSPAEQALCGSGPEFNIDSRVRLINEDFTIDFTGISQRNTRMEYRFTEPLIGGGPNGGGGAPPCQSPSCDCIIPDVKQCPPPYSQPFYKTPLYSVAEPFGMGNAQLNVSGGTLRVNLDSVGRFLSNIEVTEWKGDTLLTTTNRTFILEGVDCVTAVNDQDHESISVAPNPTTGRVSIQASFEFSEVRITSIRGEQHSFFISGDKIGLDLQNMPPGIYVVQVIANKLIKNQLLLLSPIGD